MQAIRKPSHAVIKNLARYDSSLDGCHAQATLLPLSFEGVFRMPGHPQARTATTLLEGGAVMRHFTHRKLFLPVPRAPGMFAQHNRAIGSSTTFQGAR